jgi:hypothetical protein
MAAAPKTKTVWVLKDSQATSRSWDAIQKSLQDLSKDLDALKRRLGDVMDGGLDTQIEVQGTLKLVNEVGSSASGVLDSVNKFSKTMQFQEKANDGKAGR